MAARLAQVLPCKRHMTDSKGKMKMRRVKASLYRSLCSQGAQILSKVKAWLLLGPLIRCLCVTALFHPLLAVFQERMHMQMLVQFHDPKGNAPFKETLVLLACKRAAKNGITKHELQRMRCGRTRITAIFCWLAYSCIRIWPWVHCQRRARKRVQGLFVFLLAENWRKSNLFVHF